MRKTTSVHVHASHLLVHFYTTTTLKIAILTLTSPIDIEGHSEAHLFLKQNILLFYLLQI